MQNCKEGKTLLFSQPTTFPPPMRPVVYSKVHICNKYDNGIHDSQESHTHSPQEVPSSRSVTQCHVHIKKGLSHVTNRFILSSNMAISKVNNWVYLTLVGT